MERFEDLRRRGQGMGSVVGAGGGTVAVLCLAAGLAQAGARPSSVVLAVLASFLPYAFLLREDRTLDPKRGTRVALGLAAVAGTALVLAPAVLSDDLYRYLWDGRVLLHGIDPFLYAPNDPALASLRDQNWAQVNHPEIPTIYPPVAQALFAIAALTQSPIAFKALALACHLALIPLVAKLAGHGGGRAALIYGLNPLALTESALSGHVDAFAALCMTGGILLLIRGKTMGAAMLSVLATGTKLIGLVLLPVLAKRRGTAAFLSLCLSAAVLSPFMMSADTGLGHYARRWRGNEGPFILVEQVTRRGLEAMTDRSDAPGHLRLPALRPLLRAVAGSPLDPRANVLGEKKEVPDPADFELGFLAGLVARAVVVAGVFGLAMFLAFRRSDPLSGLRWVLLLALLFAPQVHPWYLMWLLPLEAALERKTGLLWSALVLVAYVPLDGFVAHHAWQEGTWPRVLEYGAVIMALFGETWWLGRSRRGPA